MLDGGGGRGGQLQGKLNIGWKGEAAGGVGVCLIRSFPTRGRTLERTVSFLLPKISIFSAKALDSALRAREL